MPRCKKGAVLFMAACDVKLQRSPFRYIGSLKNKIQLKQMGKTPALPQQQPEDLLASIISITERARQHIRQSVNSAMVLSYWEIGRLIIDY